MSKPVFFFRSQPELWRRRLLAPELGPRLPQNDLYRCAFVKARPKLHKRTSEGNACEFPAASASLFLSPKWRLIASQGIRCVSKTEPVSADFSRASQKQVSRLEAKVEKLKDSR